MKNKIRVGFIGCGKMASEILTIMTNPGATVKFESSGYKMSFIVSDRHEAKLRPFMRRCAVTLDNKEVVKNSDYVFIAVQSKDAKEALSSVDLSKKIVISVIAGVSIFTLKKLTGATKIVRIMPNMNVAACEGFTMFAAEGIDDDEKKVLKSLLGSIGMHREIEESKMDFATGLAESSPAFLLLTIKAFFDEAMAWGMERGAAKLMSVQTVLGTAMYADNTAFDIDELVKTVSSKDGVTAEGLKILEEYEYVRLLRTAIRKSIKKAQENAEP